MTRALVLALIGTLAAFDVAYADPAPTATLTQAQQQHAREEYANCLAQGRCIETPTPTAVPTVTPQATQTSQPTPSLLSLPTATPTATLTVGPPCWTDDDGNRWLLVNGAPYFDEDGQPWACPGPLASEPADPVATDAPFVAPVIFPTQVVQVIHEITHEITVVHDAGPAAAAVEPMPADTETPTPTATPLDTATPIPADTATPEPPTPTSTPASTATSTATPTPPQPPVSAPEPPVAAAPPKPQQHLPPVAYRPEIAPDNRLLWPLPVLAPPVTQYAALPGYQLTPDGGSTGWVEMDWLPWSETGSDYVYAGAKGFTRFEMGDPYANQELTWAADGGLNVAAYLNQVAANQARYEQLSPAVWWVL